jgi:hypothetical protein
MLNSYKEALYLLRELENQDVHIAGLILNAVIVMAQQKGSHKGDTC